MKKLHLLKTVLLLCALIVGSNSLWADETITLTATNLNLSTSGSYPTGEETETVDGISYKYTDLMRNNATDKYIQAKANTGCIYNSTAFSQNIKSVAINHSGTARATTIWGSSDGTNWTQVATGSGSVSGDFSKNSYTYFKITRGSNAAYWTQIVITLADASVVAKPTFSVGTGTYNNDQNVTLSCSTTDATIYYTTNGDSPTSSSTEYTGAITVDRTMTIKAIGIKDGLTDSEIASATYTLVAATPTLSVSTGTYNVAKSVELSCTTTDAVIRYTTNGDTPTSSSTEYTSAISVDASQTIKVKAFKDGYNDSGEASATYTLKCATPTITKADGDFVTTKVITMDSSSEGATIYYTTNGDTPTSSSTAYDPSNKPVIDATTTFKAIAYKDGWSNSEVKIQAFTKETVLDNLTALVALTNTSNETKYVNLTNTQVTWTNGTLLGYMEDDACGVYWSGTNSTNTETKYYKPVLNKIYNGIFKITYKKNSNMPQIQYVENVEGAITDGSDKAPTVMTPAALDDAFTTNLGRQIKINNFTVETGKNLTENIALYGNNPYVNVTVGTTYNLIGYPYNNDGKKQFRVTSATPKPNAPTFSPDPDGGIFYEAFDLALSTTTDGATIRYTTDGTTPTSTTGNVYSSAINVSSTQTIKAIAVKDDMESLVSERTFTYYAVKQPTFVTESPVYFNDKAEVSCETDGATLYYTLATGESEPADPKTEGTAYPNDGITIDANTVKIKVIAKKGEDYSPVAEATYTLKNPDAPTADPAAGIVEPGTTVALSARAGTSIYYTLDGETEPDNNSTPYTGVITIDADKTIMAVAYDGAGNKGAVLTAAYQIFTDATFSVADMTIEVGEKKAPVVTTDSGGTVSFESNDEDIATIVDGKVNAVAKGTVTITANITASGTKRAASTTFTVTVKNPAVWESTSKGIDELTYNSLGFGTSSQETYTEFSEVSSTSHAKYAGKAVKKTDLGYIQIKSKNSDTGIVTTTSGGKARKVVVSWNSSKGSDGNTIDIYGKSSAYTGASDLFGNEDAQGTKIGSIVRGTSTELKINDDYEFIGIRSNSGTCYLDEIDIYWEGDAVSLSDASNYTPVAKDYAKVTLNRKFVAGWNGIILPFDLTTDVKTALGATEVKTLGSASESAGTVTLGFEDASLPVDAGTPVLVKLAAVQESGDVVLNGVELKTTTPTTVEKEAADNTFTLTGTYSSTSLTSSEVYLVSNDKFYHKAAGVALTAKPFRAYIVQTAAAGARIMDVNFDLEGGETTGIVEMSGNSAKVNNQYYDLQGRKVEQPTKGLYIVNGKKYVVK